MMPGFIHDDIVERIKSESDIVAIISGFVNLKKAGKDYRGLCPFHQEKTPSFFVIPNKGFYHCFGCGAGGNVINFIMQHERLEYPEALRFLANKAGIIIPDTKARRSDSDALFEAISLADSFFKKSLENPDIGEIARGYLDSRGIIKSTRETFSIGYAPSGWDGLLRQASASGIQPTILERVGLVIKKEGYYDRFRNRLMIPIRNLSGRIVGFGGRMLPGDDSGAKYINSPETEIYKKGNILFGFDLSKDHIREKNKAIVVEGYFDLIALFQCGIKNVVAVSGTGFTPEQAALLARFCERVILLYDPDSAGIRAAFRACGVLYNAGIEPRLIRLTKGYDPDTFVREKGRDNLLKMVEAATDVIDFVRNGISGKFADQPLARQERIIKALSETAGMIENPLRRGLLIKKITEQFSLPPNAIEIGPANKPASADRDSDRKLSGKEIGEIQFLKFLLENPDFIAKSIDVVDSSMFISDANAKIFELIRQAVIAGENVNIADLFDRIEGGDLRRLLSKIAITEMGKGSAETLFKDYIRPFKITSIKKEREKIYMGPEDPADLERIKELTRELKKLELENSKAKGGNE
jgi:DNA primase